MAISAVRDPLYVVSVFMNGGEERGVNPRRVVERGELEGLEVVHEPP